MQSGQIAQLTLQCSGCNLQCTTPCSNWQLVKSGNDCRLNNDCLPSQREQNQKDSTGLKLLCPLECHSHSLCTGCTYRAVHVQHHKQVAGLSTERFLQALLSPLQARRENSVTLPVTRSASHVLDTACAYLVSKAILGKRFLCLQDCHSRQWLGAPLAGPADGGHWPVP